MAPFLMRLKIIYIKWSFLNFISLVTYHRLCHDCMAWQKEEKN